MRRASIGALFAAAFAAVPAAAQDVADFYDGKTVTVVSPSGVGGSIYAYALLVSNHIGRHIPGSPDAVIEARAGGGGVRAASWMTNAAPQDGTVIAELHPSSMVVPITRGMDEANYDASAFHYLGSVAVRSYVGAVWAETGIESLEDLKGDRGAVFGASGTGSPSYQTVRFVAHVSGANLEVIPGYESGGQTNLAIERGEVQGRGNFYEGFLATNPDWIADGKLNFLYRMGNAHPDLAGVPTPSEFVTTEEERRMLGLLEAPLKVGQAFYAPPGTPPERVDALRTAFESMLEDDAFLEEARSLNLVINPLGWEAVRAVVDDVYTTPRETADALEAVLAR